MGINVSGISWVTKVAPGVSNGSTVLDDLTGSLDTGYFPLTSLAALYEPHTRYLISIATIFLYIYQV